MVGVTNAREPPLRCGSLMTMNRMPAVPLALLAAAITLGASGCGNDGPDSTIGSAPPSTAPSDTDAAGSTESGDTSAPTEGSDQAGSTGTPDTAESGGSTEPGGSQPIEEPTVDAATDLLVGLNEEEATAAAEEQGWTLRVARRDDEDLAMTMDLRPNRVNVEITDGQVSAIISTG